MFGAVLLYGLATVVRGERWQRLLVDEGGHPSRRDTQGLNVVGYMGNNLLPARAGDAIRVVLMAPRAALGMRSVVGTLLAERLLDVGLLVVIFVIVGYGLLGEVGGDKVEIVLLAAAARRGRRRRSPTCWCAATSGSWASSRRSPRPRSGCAARTTGCGCWASRW